MWVNEYGNKIESPYSACPWQADKYGILYRYKEKNVWNCNHQISQCFWHYFLWYRLVTPYKTFSQELFIISICYWLFPGRWFMKIKLKTRCYLTHSFIWRYWNRSGFYHPDLMLHLSSLNKSLHWNESYEFWDFAFLNLKNLFTNHQTWNQQQI